MIYVIAKGTNAQTFEECILLDKKFLMHDGTALITLHYLDNGSSTIKQHLLVVRRIVS